MAKDGKKRYRYQLTSDPIWRSVVPLLRKVDPAVLLKWLKGEKVDMPDAGFHKVERQVESQKQALNSLSTRVKTLEDLLREGEVDLDKWEVASYTQNYWECGSKNPSGVILPCTLYQVKAILKPIKASSEILLNGILAEIKKAARPVPKIAYPRTTKSLMVEIMITDFHMGKLSFDQEGNNTWPLKKAEKEYDNIISDTLARIDVSRVDRFLYPVGNDLLNIDNTHNTTTKGTPQMAGNYWEHLLLAVFKMTKRNIDKLSGIAPVYVPIVPGNHDHNSMFSLGGFLEAAFENNPNVFIDNGVVHRKYHHYGVNLIGYTHGNNVKARDLHGIMTTDQPELFGKTKHRAFHIGHFHINRRSKIIFKDFKDEYQGVTVEICPTLTPTDRWHYEKGYIGSLRRSKTFVWDKTKGLVKELYYNL